MAAGRMETGSIKRNGGMMVERYEEKFFIRCVDPDNGEVYMTEIIGDNAFEYKGFRFFVNGGRVSDALCGMVIFAAPKEGIMYYELVEKAQQKLKKNFKKYIRLAKKRKRANWVRKTVGNRPTA